MMRRATSLPRWRVRRAGPPRGKDGPSPRSGGRRSLARQGRSRVRPATRTSRGDSSFAPGCVESDARPHVLLQVGSPAFGRVLPPRVDPGRGCASVSLPVDFRIGVRCELGSLPPEMLRYRFSLGSDNSGVGFLDHVAGVVYAGAGRDAVSGGDRVYGGAGDDSELYGIRVWGGPGDDEIYGSSATEANVAYGGPGHDTLKCTRLDVRRPRKRRLPG
jgi:hypothetical protein